jgi:hypothetical protein
MTATVRFYRLLFIYANVLNPKMKGIAYRTLHGVFVAFLSYPNANNYIRPSHRVKRKIHSNFGIFLNGLGRAIRFKAHLHLLTM